LIQEDNAKATKKRKKIQSLLKNIMTKVAQKKTSGDKGGQQKEQMKISIKKKRREINKNPMIRMRRMKRRRLKQTKLQQITRRQGHRKKQVILDATDAHGCSHKDLLELKIAKQLSSKKLHERRRVAMECTVQKLHKEK
jgi:hypothetical protein